MATTLLINRAGLMVMTFLSLYLIEEFNYSESEAGFIVGFYGIGSIVGVALGGYLAGIVGFLRIQILALITSGIVFISMFYATEYMQFIILTFLVSATADQFRPANMASVPWFSSKKNRTRSIALIRLAINLGISIGPAVGGFLVIKLGYSSLFWVDGITCIVAGIFLFITLGAKDPALEDRKNFEEVRTEIIQAAKNSKLLDPRFYWLLVANFFWAFAFFQIIYGFTVFMKNDLFFDELTIGLFYTFNGLAIFFIEMPLVQALQKRNTVRVLKIGVVLCAISFIFLYCPLFSFVFLYFGKSFVILFPILYMVFITVGEMFYLPFTNTLALEFTNEEGRAKQMGYYAQSFSISHVLGPMIGLWLADTYGFDKLWILCFVIMILVFFMTQKLKKPSGIQPNSPL